MKKRLTQSEEFDIMKLVLDKFLWLGFAIMIFGMYVMVTGVTNTIMQGLAFMIAGAIILVLFMLLLLKEYELIK